MEQYSFDSIAGYEAEKEELKRLCELLNNRGKFVKKGAKIPKGIIFYGETGTGKTLFAKVLAAECGLPFINVDLTDAETTEAVCGRIRNAFMKAEDSGEYTVVFIDEIDKIIPDESRDYISEQSKRVLTQLLTLIDGIKSSGKVFFAATCNDYDYMPRSLVRAGRIDKKIRLGLPKLKSRAAILDYYIGKTQCRFEYDNDRIAALCVNFSGAEIQTFVNECVICSDDDNFVSKKIIYKKITEISSENICDGSALVNTKLQAVHNVGHFVVAQILFPSTYILNGKSYFVGNDFFGSMTYDYYDKDDEDYDDYEDIYSEDEDIDIDNYVEVHDDSDKEKDDDLGYYSGEDYSALLAVLAGGYVSEKIFFGKIYGDCADDFRRIDSVLYKMSSYGMLGYKYYYNSNKEYSEAFLERFMIKKNDLVEAAVSLAEKIITENIQLAGYLVSLLLKNATIAQDELDPAIEDFLEGHRIQEKK